MYGYFFTSPTSNTDTTDMPVQPTPASRHITSTAMSRSDSRDSAISTASSYSAAWDITSRPGSSAMAIPFPTQRRTSSSSSNSVQCGWFPSPYRSCLSNAALEDSTTSYLSDDDLLYLPPPAQVIPTTRPELQRELSTEEQIALLREQAEKEDQAQPLAGYRAEAWWTQQHRPQLPHQPAYADIKKAKAVRFAPGQAQVVTSGRRRSSATAPPKKRSPTVRRNLVELGQQ